MNLFCNDQLVLENVTSADTFMKRLRGYMFYKKPHRTCLVFKPCNSIHTFFMRFEIDVLFLDESGRVIKIMRKLEKNRMILPIKNGVTTVESFQGDFSQIHEGDMIKIY